MLAEDFRILIGEQIDELVPMGSVTRRNFRLKQLCDAGYLSSRSIPAPGRPNRLAYYLGSRAWELTNRLRSWHLRLLNTGSS